MNDQEFTELYNKYKTNQERADASGYSPAYISIKASKLGLTKKKEAEPEKDKMVIVIESGSYTRSYLTYATDAEVKAKELRQVIELNDTDFKPKSFKTRDLTQKELDTETFHTERLKRHFGD
jgi:hypothetical protein